MNRLTLILATLTVSISSAMAQVTLEDCQRAARENYPMIRQFSLIEESRNFNLRNASMAQIPQVGLSAKATYQTAVTSVPVPNITPLPKDQYQVLAEITQSIWDGGTIKAQKQSIETSATVENKSLQVDIYTLRERVNNLFFGIITLDKQLEINILLDDELKRNLSKVESYVQNGIANSADLDAVKVEQISNRQKRVAIESTRTAYTKMLAEMTGLQIEKVEQPPLPSELTKDIHRPELAMFDSQISSTDIQRHSINARIRPRIGAFVQGAYSNPGLDMLKAGFTPYAIGGVRINWNIGSLYTRKNDLAQIEVSKSKIETQRATFLYNTNLQVTQVNGEIERIRKQMNDDDTIITLRGNIKRAAEAKVAAGTMTVNDMLREVTAENSAIQAKSLHEIELLKSIYDIQKLLGQ